MFLPVSMPMARATTASVFRAYEKIAAHVHVGKSQVERDLIAAMEAMIKEPARAVFELEMRHLDEIWPGSTKPHAMVITQPPILVCKSCGTAHGSWVGQRRGWRSADDQQRSW